MSRRTLRSVRLRFLEADLHLVSLGAHNPTKNIAANRLLLTRQQTNLSTLMGVDH